MLPIGQVLEHKETHELYVLVERLPLSWVKVLVKQDDPDVEIQIFPAKKIKLFRKVE